LQSLDKTIIYVKRDNPLGGKVSSIMRDALEVQRKTLRWVDGFRSNEKNDW